MKKTVEISTCGECPNFEYLTKDFLWGFCDHKERYSKDELPEGSLPPWCPLPTVEELAQQTNNKQSTPCKYCKDNFEGRNFQFTYCPGCGRKL